MTPDADYNAIGNAGGSKKKRSLTAAINGPFLAYKQYPDQEVLATKRYKGTE
jgi:hypothetical protein